MGYAFTNDRFTVFDGGMGTMLEQSGVLEPALPPPVLNITHPETVEDIHKAYIDAGSEYITTNTFEANRFKLEKTPYSVEEVVREGVNRAKKAGAKKVALDIGPTGYLLEPMGDLPFEQAYDAFAEMVRAGSEADAIILETFADLNELRAAILAAKENSSLPIIASMTFTEDGRTFTGTDVVSFVKTAEALGVDALGVNCSLAPTELYSIVESIASQTTLPIIVQANAGLPSLVDGKSVYSIGASEYAEAVEKFIDLGVTILGGCCGTTPEYIAEIVERLQDKKPVQRQVDSAVYLTTPSSYYCLDDTFSIVGERINPTGRELLKKAIENRNYDLIYKEAISQEEQGADIIDVNMGVPGIDEPEILKEVTQMLSLLVSTPLQLDSSKPEALERALRFYPGIALVNSVNATEKSLESVLPLVKKYGACVIGLTLDENGIPNSPEVRAALAKKIIERAEEYGISKDRIVIDTLALTASAGVENARVCLDTIPLIKDLGVKTILGVSNISFGLPNRDLFNSHFLSFALQNGLDMAIINPGSEAIMGAVNVYKVFLNEDTTDYIKTYADVVSKPSESQHESQGNLIDFIIDGMTESALEETEVLLEKMSAPEIIDNYFVPALNEVGKRYESGEIFLPQLMQSAKSVQAAFDLLKSTNEDEKLLGEKILIATVEGDIHDIGKNIVKMMLENYGYDIVDLGADVKIERIIDSLEKNDISLVGLSALMTTTVESMQKTIEAIRELDKDIKIMVGGAVLTPEYAESIGADYYAEDAQASVRIANDYYENGNDRNRKNS